jgi:hypothetical protein
MIGGTGPNSDSRGNPSRRHVWKPPCNGRTLVTPYFRSLTAVRALLASFGAGTVQHYFPPSGNLAVALVQVFHGNPKRPRNRAGLGQEVERMSEVNHRDRFMPVHLLL